MEFLAPLIAGIISKYLDDYNKRDKILILIYIISIPVWIIFAYLSFEIALAIAIGVFIAGKIDTKILSEYFVLVILSIILASILIYIEILQKDKPFFKLVPFVFLLIGVYLDEIYTIGKIRPWVYVMMLVLGLISLINIQQLNFDNYLKFLPSILYLVLFDIGYYLTSAVLNKRF
jgi:hypothetical protein